MTDQSPADPAEIDLEGLKTQCKSVRMAMRAPIMTIEVSKTEELIAEIAATIPPGVSSFLLTSKQEIDAIIHQQKRCGVNTIQLCDRLIAGSHRELRSAMPGAL